MGVLTVWIRLPSPFIYLPYPSDYGAWQIPCGATVSSNGSSFSGVVEDAMTGNALPGASVVIGGQNLTADSGGSFFVPVLPRQGFQRQIPYILRLVLLLPQNTCFLPVHPFPPPQ
jgi:hypothetical protein